MQGERRTQHPYAESSRGPAKREEADRPPAEGRKEVRRSNGIVREEMGERRASESRRVRPLPVDLKAPGDEHVGGDGERPNHIVREGADGVEVEKVREIRRECDQGEDARGPIAPLAEEKERQGVGVHDGGMTQEDMVVLPASGLQAAKRLARLEGRQSSSFRGSIFGVGVETVCFCWKTCPIAAAK